MTNWRLKSSVSLRRIANCLGKRRSKLFSSTTFQQAFLEARGVVFWSAMVARGRWVRGMHVELETTSDVAVNFVVL